MLSTRESARACSGAEASELRRVFGMIEALPALNAVALDDAMPSVLEYDEALTITNIVRPATPYVARMAGRHEVRPVVVKTVRVEMIDYECSRLRMLTGKPANLYAAPVARVHSGADSIVENDTVLRDLRGFVRNQRVMRKVDVGVFTHTASLPES